MAVMHARRKETRMDTEMDDICVYNRVTHGGDPMRFVSVRDLRGKSSEIWRELSREREMVVTNNGRPIAILATVNESSMEQSLAAFRQVRAVDAVARLQRQSVERGTDRLSMADVDAEIDAARRDRRGCCRRPCR